MPATSVQTLSQGQLVVNATAITPNLEVDVLSVGVLLRLGPSQTFKIALGMTGIFFGTIDVEIKYSDKAFEEYDEFGARPDASDRRRRGAGAF